MEFGLIALPHIHASFYKKIGGIHHGSTIYALVRFNSRKFCYMISRSLDAATLGYRYMAEWFDDTIVHLLINSLRYRIRSIGSIGQRR
jgi:hypothetical protein